MSEGVSLPTPPSREAPLAERLEFYTARMPDGCWYWTGTTRGAGYGSVRADNGRQLAAHRAMYELRVGPIPDGLVLDHLCRNPPCVNPAHLEPVTNRENILRGVSPCAENARRTRCVNGHEFTPENARFTVKPDGKPRRVCRACDRARPSRRPRTTPYCRLVPDEVAGCASEIAAMLNEPGASLRSVASELGVSRCTVFRGMRKAGYRYNGNWEADDDC